MSLIEKWKKNGRKNFHICQNLHPHQISEKCKVVNVFDGDLVESDLRKAIDELRVREYETHDSDEDWVYIKRLKQKIFGSEKVRSACPNTLIGQGSGHERLPEQPDNLSDRAGKLETLPSEKPTDEKGSDKIDYTNYKKDR